MTAGDIETYRAIFTETDIVANLTNNSIVVADKIVPVVKGGDVIFVVIKAA